MLNYNQNLINHRPDYINQNYNNMYQNDFSTSSSGCFYSENIKQESICYNNNNYFNYGYNISTNNNNTYFETSSSDSTASSASYASSPIQSNNYDQNMDYLSQNINFLNGTLSNDDLDLSDSMLDDTQSVNDQRQQPVINRGGRKQVKTGTTKRNARERNRVRYINNCFEILRERIPLDLVPDHKNRKLSKVETLKYATIYIKQLTILLEQSEKNVNRLDNLTKIDNNNKSNLVTNNKVLNKNTSNVSFNNININIYGNNYNYDSRIQPNENIRFYSHNQTMSLGLNGSSNTIMYNQNESSNTSKQLYFNCAQSVIPSIFATAHQNKWV